ncbi:MAG: peptidoglycan editing factor PgeF [Anaerolineae bacterium]
MPRQQTNGLVYYCFANLASCHKVFHGVFTRLGGVSPSPYDSLNVGHFVGDDREAVEANHDLICQALGISRGDITAAHQVHGSQVALVGPEDRGRVLPVTDALITDASGVALMLRFADCLPVLLYDPVRRAIGLAHAGWKGTIGGIAAKTVSAMMEAYGSRPGDIIAGLGPCIGPCCYQVGTEVIELVKANFNHWQELLHPQGDGSLHFDLREANRRQLAELGVKEIEMIQLCTACRTDEFFSYRAAGGHTGCFAVVLGMRG